MTNDREANSGELIEPIAVRMPTAVKISGLSRSSLYEAIKAGDLEIIKYGKVTLVPVKSLRRFLERNIKQAA